MWNGKKTAKSSPQVASKGSKSRAAARRKIGKGRGSSLASGYAGNFRKITRKSGRGLDRFNRDGVLVVKEVAGEANDQDCVYVMNEAVNSRDVLFFSITAILRKLVEKAGLRPQGVGDAFIATPALSDGSANFSNYQVHLVKINLQTGATTLTQFVGSSTDTLAIVSAFFLTDIEEYSAGFGRSSDDNARIPYKFILMSKDASLASVAIPMSEVLIDECHIEVYGKSEMKIQNRTVAIGGSEDAENVRNNPVQGRVYGFNGIPRAKNSGKIIAGTNVSPVFFERIDYPLAVQAWGGGDVTDTVWKEPPVPSTFWNCYASAGVRLDPGQIKSFFVTKTRTMPVMSLWKAIRLQVTAASSISTYSIFPFQVIAMEDVINAGGTEQVTLGFEIQRTLGIRAWFKPKKFMKTYFEQFTET